MLLRDVVIVDPAGRLHTQANLMKELAKARRMGGREARHRHETLLVIDGSDDLHQARFFGEAVSVSATPLTELDGSAKGGSAVAIAHELGLPVKVVGVGERIDDMRPFDPEDFGRPLIYS